MSALEQSLLSRAEARSLTDEVKNDAERLWRKLVELYEGGAHEALGYASWPSYFKAEFGGEKSQAYRILDAGRVAKALDSPNGGMVNERAARELAPLLRQPEKLREVWADVVEQNPEPTAKQVREVVAQHVPPMNGKALESANANVRRVYTALSSIEGYCVGLTGVRIDRVLSVATPEDLRAWDQAVANAITELNRLRRSLREGT